MDSSRKLLNVQASSEPFYVLGNNAGNLYALVAFQCVEYDMYLGFKGQSVRVVTILTLTLFTL